MSLFINRAAHGGINYAELDSLGINPGEILDFSANISPFGPPLEVREALQRADISTYPDSNCGRLRKALADKLGVKPDNIIAGSGSTEIMRLAALAFFRPGDKVLIVEPAFGEYEVSCRIAGAEIIRYTLKAEDNFSLAGSRQAELTRLIDEGGPQGLFFNNPNNPTGKFYAGNIVEKLVQAMKDSLVVLDEAYISFVDSPQARWNSLDLIKGNKLLVLRSMTKDYAIAGLRLGYGVAHPEIVSRLHSICPPWNVNTIAQEAGLEALKADSYLKKSLQEIRKVKTYFTGALKTLGLRLEPSDTNFFLVKTGNGALWRQELLKRKILVRDCASFGLPEYIRISTRTREDCDKLLSAVKEIKGIKI